MQTSFAETLYLQLVTMRLKAIPLRQLSQQSLYLGFFFNCYNFTALRAAYVMMVMPKNIAELYLILPANIYPMDNTQLLK